MQKTLTGLAALLLSLTAYWVWPVSRADAQVTTVSINDISETEGDSGKITVSFLVTLADDVCDAGNQRGPIIVEYTVGGGSATRVTDYEVFGDKVSFDGYPLCSTTAGIQTEIYGDKDDEGDENFFVNLTTVRGGGAIIIDDEGKATIEDDDQSDITISVRDYSDKEGDSGQKRFAFRVELSGSSLDNIIVHAYTEDGTAKAGDNDYIEIRDAEITFVAGRTVEIVEVSVIGDIKPEITEQFKLKLTDARGAEIGDDEALGAIKNDDGLSVSDVRILEGKKNETKQAIFYARLSGPADDNVEFDYESRNGTAAAPGDYSEVSGTLFIPSGLQEVMIPVEIYGDDEKEDDEKFYIDITRAENTAIADGEGEGTIQNDDLGKGGGGEGGDTGGDEKTAPRLLPLCSNTPPDYKEFSAIVKECNADSSCKGKESVLGAKAGAWASGHNCCFPDAPPGFKAEGGAYMWGGCTTSNFFEFLRNIIRFLALYLATTLAAIFIAYGGFVILTSGGNASRYAEGKKAITIALIGLAIALGSFLIINTIFKVLTGGEYTTVPE